MGYGIRGPNHVPLPSNTPGITEFGISNQIMHLSLHQQLRLVRWSDGGGCVVIFIVINHYCQLNII